MNNRVHSFRARVPSGSTRHLYQRHVRLGHSRGGHAGSGLLEAPALEALQDAPGAVAAGNQDLAGVLPALRGGPLQQLRVRVANNDGQVVALQHVWG